MDLERSTLVELDRAFKLLGQGMSREKLQEIVDQVDENGTGELDWVQFLKVMRILYPEKRREFEREFYGVMKNFPEFAKEDFDVFVETFRKFDFEGINAINAEGLGKLFEYMGQGCSKEKLQRIIEAVDDNQNGVIDWIEFLVIMKSLYPGRKAPPPSKTSAPSQAPTKIGSGSNTSSSSSSSSSSTTAAPGRMVQLKPRTESNTDETKPVKSSGSGESTSAPPPGANKCNACGKTVYKAEALLAMNVSWHKGCFKCQESGCGITLNLKNFKGSGGKVYCSKHVPMPKATAQTGGGL